MKTKTRLGLLFASAVLALSLTGCVAVVAGAAGAGTVAYVEGRIDAPLNANYTKSRQAVDLAIKQLEFALINEHHDALTAYFTARTAGDKKISITLMKVTDSTSRVQIRVGIFGDENLSLTVLNKIKANL